MVPNIAFPATAFVRALSVAKRDDALNPWNDSYDDFAGLRREQLASHLRSHNARILFLSECSRLTDTNYTGVPMCSEDMAVAGLVPRVALSQRVSSGNYPVSDCISAELWRSLAVNGCAEQAMCFALDPFIPMDSQNARAESLLAPSIWAQNIIRWHRGIRVVAVGETAAHVLNCLRIECDLIRVSGRGVATVHSQVTHLLRDKANAPDIANPSARYLVA